MDNFKEQLKEFITTNNVIGITAGVSIGAATKDAISSLVKDIIFPLIVIVLNKINVKYVGKIITDHNKLQILECVRQITTWVLLVLFTYLFIRIAFLNFLGIEKKNLEKKN